MQNIEISDLKKYKEIADNVESIDLVETVDKVVNEEWEDAQYLTETKNGDELLLTCDK